MTPVQFVEHIREQVGDGTTAITLSASMACQLAAALEETAHLAGTFTVLAASDRYQQMSVEDAITELYQTGMPVPEESLALTIDDSFFEEE